MTNEEIIIEKLGNVVTALELDNRKQNKILSANNIKSWFSIILSVVALGGFVAAPFINQHKSIDKNKEALDVYKSAHATKHRDIDDRLNTMQYIIWSEVEGADKFLDNPYRSRGGTPAVSLDNLTPNCLASYGKIQADEQLLP